MSVNLTKDGFYLNGLKIENKQTPFSHIIELLGNDYRKIELKYGIALLVFDSRGIRLWIENDRVNQVQIMTSRKEKGDKFPYEIYREGIILNDKELSLPISFVDIMESGVEFIWDDDSRQYDVNIIYLILEKYKFPVRLDKEAMLVNHISS